MEYLAEKLGGSKDRLASLKAYGWGISDEIWANLSDLNKSYAYDEFGLESPKYFENRLQNLGFEGMECVLDAGCGHGRWSLPLAKLNKSIIGYDNQEDRLQVAKSLLDNHEMNNAEFKLANLEELQLDDGSVDGIFCYSALMFTNITKTLSEFNRVLVPGGKVYLNYNNVGWYIHLLLVRGLAKGRVRPMITVLKYCYRTMAQKNQGIVITNSRFDHYLDGAGFKLQYRSAEGCINVKGHENDLVPIHKAKFYGLPAVVEVIFEKL